MPETAYVFALDAAGLNYGRVRLTTVSGRVFIFVVQQETTLDGKGIPVVRYDNHHGFCHRDQMNRRGDVVEKLPIAGSPGEVATFAVNDIKTNWEAYLEEFWGNTA